MSDLEVFKLLVTQIDRNKISRKDFKKEFGIDLSECPEIGLNYDSYKDVFEVHFIFQNSYDGKDVCGGYSIERFKNFLKLDELDISLEGR